MNPVALTNPGVLLILTGLLSYATAILVALATNRNPRLCGVASHGLVSVGALLSLIGGIYLLVSGVKGTTPGLYSLPILSELGANLSLRINPLSSLMVVVISLVSLYSSIFAIPYIDEYFGRKNVGVLTSLYALFIASMTLVVLSNDAFWFMVFWELMSVSSYFLVVFEHERQEVKNAGSIYFTFTHIGGLSILVAFLLLYMNTGSLSFDAFSNAMLPSNMAALIILLAFLGFGSKAGVVPFHVWLPLAHPVAPSHVSALMSGVMVKVAVYGMILLAMDFVNDPTVNLYLGAVILIIAAITTFYGVALAVMQHNLKRLLAYHTIENIGIIFLGLAVAMVAKALNHEGLVMLAIVASLFHILNHAIFKSLLFLTSGAILHQTHTLDIDELGGLAKAMKATTLAFLLGSMAISAIPPLNGFASEWLVYHSLLLLAFNANNMVAGIAILAVVALSAAGVLAVYCFTKVFGTAFLGIARSEHAKQAEPEPALMKYSYVIPVALCIILGVGMPLAVKFLSTAAAMYGSSGLYGVTPFSVEIYGWKIPTTFSAPVIAAGLVLATLFAAMIHGQTKARITEPFVSGVKFDATMVPVPTFYTMPLKKTLASLYASVKVKRYRYDIPDIVAGSIEYDDEIETALERPEEIKSPIAKSGELVERLVYVPLIYFSSKLVQVAKHVQSGYLYVYLLYIFATLFALIFIAMKV
jgi:hydrogenase-4 component B